MANAISGDGSVVVGRSTSRLGPEAFLWTRSGGLRGLGDLPGGAFFSSANDVSANGSVVVGSSKAARFQDVLTAAFVWDAENGMRNLSEVLAREPDVDLTGWILLDATGVSPDGRTIVGWGLNPAGDSEAWVATLPARVFERQTTEQTARAEAASSPAAASQTAALPCAAPPLMAFALLGFAGIVHRRARITAVAATAGTWQAIQ